LAVKFQAIAERTAKVLRGCFFDAPGTLTRAA